MELAILKVCVQLIVVRFFSNIHFTDICGFVGERNEREEKISLLYTCVRKVTGISVMMLFIKTVNNCHYLAI